MSTNFLNVETMNEINSRLNSELLKLDEQYDNQVWYIIICIILWYF